MGETVIWAVLFSNYEPAEVAALYDNQAAAEEHADALGSEWRAVRWGQLQSTYQPEQGNQKVR
jgi:hypothetical protein